MINAVLLLIALAIGGIGSGLSARRILPRVGVIDFLIVSLVAFAAQIVLIAEIASAFRVLGAGAFLVGHALTLAIATILGRSARLNSTPRSDARERPPHSRSGLPRSAAFNRKRLSRTVVCGILLACIVPIMAASLYVAARSTVPLNFDANTYRLPRIAFWLQSGAIEHVPTRNQRINLMAYNDALLMTWVIAFHRDWTLVHLVQWACAAGLLLTTYRLARWSGLAPPFSLLAVLMLCGLPLFIVQSCGVQSDITAAFMVTAFCYFLLRGVLERSVPWLAMSGVALGLAVGTKLTVVLAGPALLLLCLVSWLSCGAWRDARLVLAWCSAALIGVATLGSLAYVKNTVAYHHPFASPDVWSSEAAHSRTVYSVFKNIKRELYGCLSPMPAPEWALRPLCAIRDALFAWSSTPQYMRDHHRFEFDRLMSTPGTLNHDVVYTGTIPTLLMLAVLVCWRPRAGGRDWRAYGMLLAAAAFFLLIATFIRYMPFNGRFLLTVAPLASVAVIYALRRIRRTSVRAVSCVLLAGYSTLWGWYGLRFNSQQPLFGPSASPLVGYAATVEVEPGDRIGLLGSSNGLIAAYMFPLDGRYFVPLNGLETGAAIDVQALLERLHLTTLIVDPVDQPLDTFPRQVDGYYVQHVPAPGSEQPRLIYSRHRPRFATGAAAK